ncbi:MAG TPA: M20/M25/M40 family metallo-hydrolase [Chondromyces sp.]|nr:M20/M25/M40 family metallo-hydrolase [Chondromyces sp.]
MAEYYQSKEQLTNLLYKLVAVPSVSRTKEENDMADQIIHAIEKIPYFDQYPERLLKHETEDGRFFITAFHQKPGVKKTVILVSHFDVVDVEDYGAWQSEAFQPEALVALMEKYKGEYSKEVQEDLASGDWLFGRGTMDMKAGLALHISLLEQACNGGFDGNVLLLTVPDEEVSSVGMREAVPALIKMAEQYDLEYRLILNAEPIFPLYPGDMSCYLYTGSIGKILPGFLCYGQETHVGEPLSGLNASIMNAFIAEEMELNIDFSESAGIQQSPPPTALYHRDLKKDYSAQIPNRAAALYNVLFMKRSIEELTEMLHEAAKRAAKRIEQFYQIKNQQYAKLAGRRGNPSFKVRTLTFAELKNYAEKNVPRETIHQLESEVLSRQDDLDDRELSIELVDRYALLCKELAPMIVLFYAPPFYPAIQSEGKEMREWANDLIDYAWERHGLSYKIAPYFNGICDLSYVSLKEDIEKVNIYTGNVPVWGKTYDMPIEAMSQLQVPAMNLGPVGRDAHQQTERLHAHYAFVLLKDLSVHLLNKIFKD